MTKLLESATSRQKQNTPILNSNQPGQLNKLLDSLILTKLNRPTLPKDLVHRPRLTSWLEDRRERPFTLVSAPLGYGKTTLISCWLEATDYPASWISLDERDNYIGIFLSYLVAAIQGIFPNSMAETQALLLVSPRLPIAATTNLVVNELNQIEDDFILVLDDFHTIGNKEIHELIHKILIHPPRHLHLVIGTRRDPLFSLAPLRASSKLTEIRIQDIRFNKDETHQFLTKYSDSKINWNDVIDVDTLVEGWVAGLRLAALAMRHRIGESDQKQRISAQNQYVTEYLITEILAKQDSRYSNCMKKISILDRFCADLCEAICFRLNTSGENQSNLLEGQGKQFLDWLQASNLFVIPLDDQNEWFRFHHLFQIILQQELSQMYTQLEIKELHAATGYWYANQAKFEEALTHLLHADETTAAIDLVAQQRTRLMNADQWLRLERWLNLFPQQLIEKSTELWMLKIWLTYHHGQWSELSAMLDHMATILIRKPNLEITKKISGEISSLRSLIAYHAGNPEEAIFNANQALDFLPDDCWSVRILARSYLGLGLLMSGDESGGFNTFYEYFKEEKMQNPGSKALLLMAACYFHWISADLEGSLQAAKQSIALCPSSGYESILGYGKYNLGRAHYQRNELAVAEELFASVVAKPFQNYGDCYLSSACGLALTYQAQGKTTKAHQAADETIAFILENGNTSQIPVTQALQAELALTQGRLPDAILWAEKLGKSPPLVPLSGFIAPQMTLIKVWLEQNTPTSLAKADRFLNQVSAYLKEIHNTLFLIETLALQAMFHDVSGNRTAVQTLMEEALSLARPGDFIRLFVDLGPKMEYLLSRLHIENGMQGYIDQIRSAFVGAQEKPLPMNLDEFPKPLTIREFEVLELLSMRLTNKEIAAKLVVAPGTIKAHNIRIYRKLAVNCRREAVERALALGIL